MVVVLVEGGPAEGDPPWMIIDDRTPMPMVPSREEADLKPALASMRSRYRRLAGAFTGYAEPAGAGVRSGGWPVATGV
jgi:hypothetical protein